MKVLVLGSGAREHAMASKLSQSPLLQALWLAPGNALAARDLSCIACDISRPDEVVALSQKLAVDLVVVGPEAPLLAGVVDALQVAGILALGPVAAAAQLEGSKAYAKTTMQEAGIRTAPFASFESIPALQLWLGQRRSERSLVVKADGLMAGKGVIVCDDVSDVVPAAEALFAQGQTRVVVEERLRGREVSLIALCDGIRYRLFPLARDHKRLLTGDLGKNTGGMGAFCPVSLSANEFERQPVQSAEALAQETIAPILALLHKRGAPFRGFLFAGLMFDEGRAHVLEYNARLGDPETQALLCALDGDLLPSFVAAARGELGNEPFGGVPRATVCIVLAAKGYPDAPQPGDVISGIEEARAHEGVYVFGAGVKAQGDALLTSGGRVLSVVGRGTSLTEAREAAYRGADAISFAGMQRREDIAATA